MATTSARAGSHQSAPSIDHVLNELFSLVGDDVDMDELLQQAHRQRVAVANGGGGGGAGVSLSSNKTSTSSSATTPPSRSSRSCTKRVRTATALDLAANMCSPKGTKGQEQPGNAASASKRHRKGIKCPNPIPLQTSVASTAKGADNEMPLRTTLPLRIVFAYLDAVTLARAATVSTSWKHGAYREELWMSLYLRRWPDGLDQRPGWNWRFQYGRRMTTQARWRTGACEPLPFVGHKEAVFAVKIVTRTSHLDDPYVLSASDDGSICVWEYKTQKLVHTFNPLPDAKGRLTCIDVYGDSVVTGAEDGSFAFHEISSGKAKMATQHVLRNDAVRDFEDDSDEDDDCMVHSILCCAVVNHQCVAVGGAFGVVYSDTTWPDLNKQSVPPSFRGGERECHVLAVHGRQASHGSGQSGAMAVRRFSSVSPSRVRILCGTVDGAINGFELVCRRERPSRWRHFAGHDDTVTSLVVEDNTMVSGSDDRSVRVWDIEMERELWCLRGHTGPITCLHLPKPDSTWLISGSSDGTARVWSLVNGRPKTLASHKNGITSVFLSAEGHLAATSSNDQSMRLWVTDHRDDDRSMEASPSVPTGPLTSAHGQGNRHRCHPATMKSSSSAGAGGVIPSLGCVPHDSGVGCMDVLDVADGRFLLVTGTEFGDVTRWKV